MPAPHRTCTCGAVYRRTEAMAPSRQLDSFQCSVCDATLETWNTAWVPTYCLIAGPVRQPRIANHQADIELIDTGSPSTLHSQGIAAQQVQPSSSSDAR
jgi:hypothetical protein